MSSEDRLRSLLSDLGKATLRGVKKCPKCGTFNGSRGLCCKNKYCDAVFKEPGEKRKLSTEACKLITGSISQLFSVRVRDKGPDCRGFVQLPLINLTIINDNKNPSISQASPLCFVDNCEQSFDSTVLKCHDTDTSNDNKNLLCQHIQAALKCYAEGQPLTLKNSILSSLNVKNDMKQEIWLLATETTGPLVQRVSKNIMAVKCKVSPKHPLGYLHCSFFTSKFKDKIENRYTCSCETNPSNLRISNEKNDKINSPETEQKCVHFYACICAFASDPKLSEEFQYYINLDNVESNVSNEPAQSLSTDKIIGIDLECLTDDTHLLIFRDDSLAVPSINVERLDMDSINLDTAILPSNIVMEDIDVNCDETLLNSGIDQVRKSDIIEESITFDDQLVIKDEFLLTDDSIALVNNNSTAVLNGHAIFDDKQIVSVKNDVIINNNVNELMNNDSNNNSQHDRKEVDNALTSQIESNLRATAKRKRDDKLIDSNNFKINSNNTTDNGNFKEVKRTKLRPSILRKSNFVNNLDENDTNLSFIKWLASITERINQTMHFKFNGKPEPLVFHVPQIFFDCLRERISCGGKKKRLPNSTTAFVRKDGVPLGTFTKYTWRITNILQVKSIFDTPLIQLEVTRSFIQKDDGDYELYYREETEIDKFKKTGNSALIKPSELRTFLKVGNTSPNQIEPTPFLIEWIPDILPISKIGELRIRFEFGHLRNNSDQIYKKVTLSKSY